MTYDHRRRQQLSASTKLCKATNSIKKISIFFAKIFVDIIAPKAGTGTAINDLTGLMAHFNDFGIKIGFVSAYCSRADPLFAMRIGASAIWRFIIFCAKI